ncbi:MAG: magnesium/cobalt transporter CorA [Dehalococcoidia bacterium]
MIACCYRTGSGDLRLDLSPAEIGEALRESGGLLWVDIDSASRAEAEPLLAEVLGFHPLTIDDCFNDLLDPPKIDDYEGYLYVIVHEVEYDEKARWLTTRELNLYIGPNYVVSFHKTPLASVEDVRRRTEQNHLLTTRGAAFLAHALIDVVVDGFHPVANTIDEQVAVLEERVVASPGEETLHQILQLKRITQRLKRTVLPQRDVANRFARGEFGHLIAAESLMYFRDIYDHTVRVEELIESVRDLADSTLNTYLSSVNNRINEVMKTLAIVTVVFLPLTLIAGVYGTNFENVDEYGWRFGYAGMLIGMGALAVALVGWFKWRGWF